MKGIFIKAPVFDGNEEKTRTAMILSYLLSGAFLMLIIPVFIGLPFIYVDKGWTAVILLIVFIMLIITRSLLFKGYVKQASLFFITVAWIVFMSLVIVGHGMKDINFVFIIALAVVTGLLLGNNAAVIFAALSSLAGLIVAVCEVYGYLPFYYFLTPPLARYLELVIALILVTTTLYFALKSRDEALAMSHRQLEDRNRAEQKLKKSEEKYRLVVENAWEAILVVQDGMIKYVNQKTLNLIGYDGELSPRPFIDFIYPEDREQLSGYYMSMMKGEEVPEAFVVRLTDSGNRIIWVEIHAVLINWEEREAILAFMSDITERKLADDALLAGERKYHFITDQMVDMVWTLDMELKTTYVSPSVEKVLGFTPEERMVQRFEEIVPPASLARVQELYLDALLQDQQGTADPDRVLSIEVENYHKNGSIVPVEVNVRGIRDNEGKLIGFHGLSRDITERKKAEAERSSLQERLQRAEKMEALGTMAGGVAHDLNNVLGVLVGYAGLLLYEIPEGDRLRKHVMNIKLSGEKGAAIVQDLLTLARRGVKVSRVVNLNGIIDDYLQSPEFQKMSSLHDDIKVRTYLDPDLLNVKGSPVHLSKVIMNLIQNAAEAMPQGGMISVSTENHYLDRPVKGYDEIREGDYVVLTLSDTGQGIPAKDLGRIFEPFYTKKIMGRSGTGLGLSVVWGTVKDHHGYINVVSGENEGTTFTLYFPVTRLPESGDAVQNAIAEYRGAGETILVVDDVPEQRELATDIFNRLGYKADAVAGGEEAVNYLKERTVDLLILDMIMEPGIDGLETYRRIVGIRPGQKALIVSGFSETERVREAQRLGAGAYIRKPYVPEKIALAVREELDKP